jgi:hypothetical protein
MNIKKNLILTSALAMLTLQFATAGQAVTGVQTARIIADGRTNPSAIPDSVAWVLLFRTIGDCDGALPYDVRAGFLQETPFKPTEVLQIISAASSVLKLIQEMENEVSALHLSSQARTTHLLQRRERIVNDAVDRLIVGMGPEGSVRLRRHLAEVVKRGIVISE